MGTRFDDPGSHSRALFERARRVITSVPSSGGVPKHRVIETLVLPWNDPDACERLVTRHASELAAVLVDPLSNRIGFMREVEEIAAAVERAVGAVGRG